MRCLPLWVVRGPVPAAFSLPGGQARGAVSARLFGAILFPDSWFTAASGEAPRGPRPARELANLTGTHLTVLAGSPPPLLRGQTAP